MIGPLELEYRGEIPNEPGSVDVHYHLVLMNAVARADPDAALCTLVVVGSRIAVIFHVRHGLPPIYRLTIIRSLWLALRCCANVTQAIQMPGETLSEF
jgi:hypothetical protein